MSSKTGIKTCLRGVLPLVVALFVEAELANAARHQSDANRDDARHCLVIAFEQNDFWVELASPVYSLVSESTKHWHSWCHPTGIQHQKIYETVPCPPNFENHSPERVSEFEIRTSTNVGQDWPGEASDWHGFTRFDFQMFDRNIHVVTPDIRAEGNPWVWRARFPNYHPEADLILLERGWHIAYINTDGMLGSPNTLPIWNNFYEWMIERGMARRVALEGVSRGGLFVYRFATEWPERVACIYADTPVCDIKSWPGGKGDGRGHEPTWQALFREYEFADEEAALGYGGNPIDRVEILHENKIPILHIVSLNDQIVPPSENTFVLATRLRELGGEIEIIEVPSGTEASGGHHFDHPDPERVADFIEIHSSNE